MIRVVTDTAASLPQDVVDRYRIPCVAQIVIFGEESFRDGVEMSAEAFYARQGAASEPPRTSAPSPGDFEVVFRDILSETPNATILCIHPSAEVSGTIRSARPAAAEFPGADIRIFDTRSASLGQGFCVMEAAEMASQGRAVDEILARLAVMRDGMQVRFVVDTLTYLAKGGRIGRAQHLIGSLLDIKPVLRVKDGVVESHERHRTKKRALEAIGNTVISDARGKSRVRLGVVHAMAQAEAQALADRLCGELSPDVFMLAELGPSIGAHAGPGTIGVIWLAE